MGSFFQLVFVPKVDLDQANGTADVVAEARRNLLEGDELSGPKSAGQVELAVAERDTLPKPDGSADGKVDSSEEDGTVTEPDGVAEVNMDSTEGDAKPEPYVVDLDQANGKADVSAEASRSLLEGDELSGPKSAGQGELAVAERDTIPKPGGSAQGNVDSSEDGTVPEPDGAAEVNMDSTEADAMPEPYVGMEFDSEDAARIFYNEYARRLGFVVRIMQRRRSETDGRTLARRLGCNKQGFSPSQKVVFGPDKKPRPSAREGCKATILVKMEKSGKWVVSRFVKEHNHPLVVTPHTFSDAGDKDKKIEELTRSLQRQDQLCAAYRERLLKLLNGIEEQADHISLRVQEIVENVRKVESEVKKPKIEYPP